MLWSRDYLTVMIIWTAQLFGGSLLISRLEWKRNGVWQAKRPVAFLNGAARRVSWFVTVVMTECPQSCFCSHAISPPGEEEEEGRSTQPHYANNSQLRPIYPPTTKVFLPSVSFIRSRRERFLSRQSSVNKTLWNVFNWIVAYCRLG